MLQNRKKPRKPPAQHCLSPQRSEPLSTYPDLAENKVPGLCTQSLVPSSTASITEGLQNLAKPEALQSTCTALPQPPVQAPPDLLTTAEGCI